MLLNRLTVESWSSLTAWPADLYIFDDLRKCWTVKAWRATFKILDHHDPKILGKVVRYAMVFTHTHTHTHTHHLDNLTIELFVLSTLHILLYST